MRLSEDFDHDHDRDRQIDFLTGDEDNEAERSLLHDGQSTDSELVASPSTNSSHLAPMDSNSNLGPQTYRESMNMYAVAANSSSDLSKGASFHRLNQSFSRKPVSESDSSMTTRLISTSEILPPNSLSYQSFDLKPTQQCSFSQAVLNGLNILFGIGLLATPYAIKQGGWLSLLQLVLFCCISFYTGILLQRCLESSPGLHTYPDIGQAAFGAADHPLHRIVCKRLGHFISSTSPIILHTVRIRQKNVPFLLINLQNLHIAIGLYSFCFSGHSTFPSQYSSMKNPSQFPTVLMISFFISGIMYIGVAVGGYLMFGDATQSQFTLSMPPMYVATKIAVWTTVVIPVSKYA